MSRSLVSKGAVVTLLALGLLIPLEMVNGLVRGRQSRQQGVTAEVQRTTSGAQRITGPVVVIPYTVRTVEEREEVVWVNFGVGPEVDTRMVGRFKAQTDAACAAAKKTPGQTVAVKEKTTKVVITDREFAVPPESLKITGHVAARTLKRGLYEALVYDAKLTLSAGFKVDIGALADDSRVTLKQAFVAIGIADVRGIRSSPTLTWQKVPLQVQPGNDYELIGNGVHAPLADLDPKRKASYALTLTLDLIGTEQLHFSPVGKETRVALTADWPHPSFGGRMLPSSREVRSDGFSAQWRTTWFATNMDRAFKAADAKALFAQDFGVRFIQPVNPYQQTKRATDYGILFVILVFTAFFLFEVVVGLRIHPMQYSLVGAALATFYLLLIALSEHIDFLLAYAAAAGACALLATFYLSHVLQHWRRGCAFGGMLGLQYVALYAVLQSEDYALLLGSGLVFAALTAVMVLTRRFDWYAVAGSKEAPA
jgi:inner membrane protein